MSDVSDTISAPIIHIGPNITTNRRPDEILELREAIEFSARDKSETLNKTSGGQSKLTETAATLISTRLYNLVTDYDITAGANISGVQGIFDGLSITGTIDADTVDAFIIYGSDISSTTGTISSFRAQNITLRDGINSITFRDPTNATAFSHVISPGTISGPRAILIPDHGGSLAISGGTMDTYFNTVKLAGASAITNNSNAVMVNQNGAVLLATSTGSVNISGSSPTAGQVLIADGIGGAVWTTPSGGITSLNGSTASTQTFAYGTTGTAPTWSTAGGVHTLVIPNAGASVTGGLITNGTQTIAGAKTLSSQLTFSGSAGIAMGNGNYTSSGNITAGNLILAGSITLPGNISLTGSNSVLLNNGNVSSSGNFAFGNGTLQGSLTFGASAIVMNLGGTGNITSSGNLSVANITSTTNSLNGITIPATGGTLAKLSDIGSGTSNIGMYSSATSTGYTFSGSTTPANLVFATTDTQTGITKGGSNDSFTVGATGTYYLVLDGFCYSTASITWLKLRITVNGSEVDNKFHRQDSSKTFNGNIAIHSFLSLVANDVVRVTIAPDVEPVTIQFQSASVGDKNLRLVLRKL